MTSQIGLGCWALGSESYGLVTESSAKLLIHCAVEKGVTLFDTAPLYGLGLSEMRLGRYLPKDDSLRIATKVGIISDSGRTIQKQLDPLQVEKSVEDSLKRLNVESIYLLQLHSPELEFQSDDLFATLLRLKTSGKVRKIGISLKNPSFLEKQSGLFPWDSFQYNCSILDQRIAQNSSIIESEKAKGALMIARTPLNFGFLGSCPPDISNLPPSHHLRNWPHEQLQMWLESRGKISESLEGSGCTLLQAALRFPVDSGLANMVIPGAISKSELLENIQAFTRPLPDSVISILTRASEDSWVIESPYKIESN